jgi:hypothetical protein
MLRRITGCKRQEVREEEEQEKTKLRIKTCIICTTHPILLQSSNKGGYHE